MHAQFCKQNYFTGLKKEKTKIIEKKLECSSVDISKSIRKGYNQGISQFQYCLMINQRKITLIYKPSNVIIEKCCLSLTIES